MLRYFLTFIGTVWLFIVFLTMTSTSISLMNSRTDIGLYVGISLLLTNFASTWLCGKWLFDYYRNIK